MKEPVTFSDMEEMWYHVRAVLNKSDRDESVAHDALDDLFRLALRTMPPKREP